MFISIYIIYFMNRPLCVFFVYLLIFFLVFFSLSCLCRWHFGASNSVYAQLCCTVLQLEKSARQILLIQWSFFFLDKKKKLSNNKYSDTMWRAASGKKLSAQTRCLWEAFAPSNWETSKHPKASDDDEDDDDDGLFDCQGYCPKHRRRRGPSHREANMKLE